MPLSVNDDAVKLPATTPTGLVPAICVEIEGEVKPSAKKGSLDAKKDTEP